MLKYLWINTSGHLSLDLNFFLKIFVWPNQVFRSFYIPYAAVAGQAQADT